MNTLIDKELEKCVGGFGRKHPGAVLINFDKDPAPELIMIYTPHGVNVVTPGRPKASAA